MKFTKEEISLCKQVAEKHRKDLKVGMYVWREFCKTIQLIYRLEKEEKEIFTVILKRRKLNKLYWNNLEGGWLTPLWTISDCLEFLREKGFRYNLEDYRVLDLDSSELVKFIISGGEKKYCRKTFEGKAPLETCLKAVLAVLEEMPSEQMDK